MNKWVEWELISESPTHMKFKLVENEPGIEFKKYFIENKVKYLELKKLKVEDIEYSVNAS